MPAKFLMIGSKDGDLFRYFVDYLFSRKYFILLQKKFN